MPAYQYTYLAEGNIRILRLQPHRDKQSPIQCQITHIELQDSEGPCLYEALSYVWGSAERPYSIDIDGYTLSVGVNLYMALLSLRHVSLERFLWIDAICINQGNTIEKGQQVQLMAKIYAKAYSVIVWLGEEEDESEHALDKIRLAAANVTNGLRTRELNYEPILKLLKRPWFERIWVLQEVAAARHILIKCGRAELDGYAFCAGLGALKLSYDSPTLQFRIHSVSYLIRDAIFRQRHLVYERSTRFSLDISPLSELIELYHTRKATEQHDKVYALLGMCSDDLEKAGLLVDYSIPWQQLFQKLINYLVPNCLFVSTWDNNRSAILGAMGQIVGEVKSLKNPLWREGYAIEISWKAEQMKARPRQVSSWAIKALTKTVETGDIICLLHGCSRPTIIRPRRLYWEIIILMIPTTAISRANDDWEWTEILLSLENPATKFELIWDWEMQEDGLEATPSANDTLRIFSQENHTRLIMPSNSREKAFICVMYGEQGSLSEVEYRLCEIYKMLSIATVLLRSGYNHAEIYLQESLRVLDGVLLGWAVFQPLENISNHVGKNIPTLQDIIGILEGMRGGWLPLKWAIDGGHVLVRDLLLPNADPNADIGDGLTPLLWSAEEGHEKVAQLLLESGKVDPDGQNSDGKTALWLAILNRREAVVSVFVEIGKATLEDVDEIRRAQPDPNLVDFFKSIESAHK